MKKAAIHKTIALFLCFSFVLLTSGFSTLVAEAADRGYPLGEMVSRGKVLFEAREKVWKDVEPSSFPVLQGVNFKTEEGNAIIALANNCQVEVGPCSLFSLDQNDQFHLVSGSITFRIPLTSDLRIKVGALSIARPQVKQASRGATIPLPGSGETVGSIQIHPAGSVTVKSIRGELSILKGDSTVMASLSPQETLTIPATLVADNQKLAQVGTPTPAATGAGAGAGGGFLGISTAAWIALGIVGGLSLTGFVVAESQGSGPTNVMMCR